MRFKYEHCRQGRPMSNGFLFFSSSAEAFSLVGLGMVASRTSQLFLLFLRASTSNLRVRAEASLFARPLCTSSVPKRTPSMI